MRHHSPAAARLVAERIDADPPAIVLIEGPADYNDHLEQLTLDHDLPVMIYSWAPLRPELPRGAAGWAARRSAFYPLTAYSPEWAALRAADKRGIPFQFMDLPWPALADVAEAENRFAGHAESTEALERMLTEFGVDTLDVLIDELVEIDPALNLTDYRTRMHTLGEALRGPESEETRLRELFMADRIRTATAQADGVVLVVCGAAHVSGLTELLAQPAVDPPGWEPPADDDRYGIALTPTSYQALDALTGYNAGQPNPGFYDALHEDRLAGRADTAERLFTHVTAELRKAGKFVAAADLIAVLTTARGLAALRGHAQLWRTDLLDGVIGALVKDDSGGDHPLVERVHEALRGTKLGALHPDAHRPPLVHELTAEIAVLGLTPTPQSRVEPADLTTDDGLRRSQLLHSLQELEVPLGIPVASADADGVERWRITWSPEYEGQLVAAARFGGSRDEAVTTALLDAADGADEKPREAASIMLRAALCGVDELADTLQQRTATILATTGDLGGLGEALALLLRLYRYDPLLRTTGRVDIGALVTVAFDRIARLVERFGPLPDGPAVDPLIAAIKTAADAQERTAEALALPVQVWDDALAAVVTDTQQAAALRGAALGARWLSGHVPDGELAESVLLIHPVERLGDFVHGLLAVAREAALRREDLIHALDGVVTAMSEASFLGAVPGLRRAFSAYSPRDRARVASVLLGERGAAALQAFAGSGEDAIALAAFEAEAAATVERFLGTLTLIGLE